MSLNSKLKTGISPAGDASIKVLTEEIDSMAVNSPPKIKLQPCTDPVGVEDGFRL